MLFTSLFIYWILKQLFIVMPGESETFQILHAYLRTLAAKLCVVFRAKHGGAADLVFYTAAIEGPNTPEERLKLADRYYKAALHSYQQRQDFILEENLPVRGLEEPDWCGFKISTSPTPPPRDQLGRLPWHIIIGSGATREAGFVIVLRLYVKEEAELKDCIAKINDIMRKWKQASPETGE